MKRLVQITLIVLFAALAGLAQTKLPGLKIDVEGGKSIEFGAKELGALARHEINAKDHDGKNSVYSGWYLGDLLAAAGAKIAAGELRGKELGAYIVVEAADGYRGIFAIAEVSAEFTDRVVLVADKRDGKLLDEKNGPFQIIVPDDKKHGRWVRQAIVVRLKKVN